MLANNYKYKYNNKEFIDDLGLNMLDYGARLYDPLTTRWNGVDALAEKYHSTTGYGYVGGNPINRVDIDGRDWYVNTATSEKIWNPSSGIFGESYSLLGREGTWTNIGEYNVEYNSTQNAVLAYYQNDPKVFEKISFAKNTQGNYVSDKAVKFSLLAAEEGGQVSLYDALIVSASIENRKGVILNSDIRVYDKKTSSIVDKLQLSGILGRGSVTNREIAWSSGQYNALSSPSYKTFSKGHLARFGSNLGLGYIGLASVYNAMDNPVSKLQTLYGMSYENANSILIYAHKSATNKPTMLQPFDIPFEKNLAPSLKYLVGSKYYKPKF